MIDHRPWVGSLAFGPNWLLYNGVVGPTQTHAHHARQIIVSPSLDSVVVDTDGETRAGSWIEVEPNAPHSIVRGAELADVLFVDQARRPSRADRGTGRVDAPVLIQSFALAAERACEILAVMDADRDSNDDGSGFRHPAAELALSMLPDLLAEGGVSTRSLAELTGLSSSRMSHVFVRQTGLPVRSYVRWARLTAAADQLASGATFTDAAHAVGFSDGAHFSRTFRSMFGLSPTDVFNSAVFLLPR